MLWEKLGESKSCMFSMKMKARQFLLRSLYPGKEMLMCVLRNVNH